MDQDKITDAVRAYRDMTPGSIDILRDLSPDEVIALKVVLAISDAPARKPRSDRGQKRKAAADGQR